MGERVGRRRACSWDSSWREQGFFLQAEGGMCVKDVCIKSWTSRVQTAIAA